MTKLLMRVDGLLPFERNNQCQVSFQRVQWLPKKKHTGGDLFPESIHFTFQACYQTQSRILDNRSQLAAYTHTRHDRHDMSFGYCFTIYIIYEFEYKKKKKERKKNPRYLHKSVVKDFAIAILGIGLDYETEIHKACHLSW